MTPNLDSLRGRIPDTMKDIRLNAQSVMQVQSLTPAQRWGVAIACSVAARNRELTEALVADARAQVRPEVIEDAVAAAALMAMNNVYYRFQHLSGKAIYDSKPARLRMNRIASPAALKVDFELYCLAVSAIAGCETCVRSHEAAVLERGLHEDQVHDAVRIASVIQALAVALEASDLQSHPSVGAA